MELEQARKRAEELRVVIERNNRLYYDQAIYFSILLQLPSRFSAPTDNGRFNYLRYN